jgi:hypothetical protein
MTLFYAIQDAIHYTSSAISLLTTAILLYLIVKRSPREMSVYRWLIFYISATDALTTITLLLGNFRLVGMLWYTLVGKLFFILHFFQGADFSRTREFNNLKTLAAIVEGPITFPKCGYYYFSAFITSLGMNWISLPLCFTYRYFAFGNRQDILKTSDILLKCYFSTLRVRKRCRK